MTLKTYRTRTVPCVGRPGFALKKSETSTGKRTVSPGIQALSVVEFPWYPNPLWFQEIVDENPSVEKLPGTDELLPGSRDTKSACTNEIEEKLPVIGTASSRTMVAVPPTSGTWNSSSIVARAVNWQAPEVAKADPSKATSKPPLTTSAENVPAPEQFGACRNTENGMAAGVFGSVEIPTRTDPGTTERGTVNVWAAIAVELQPMARIRVEIVLGTTLLL